MKRRAIEFAILAVLAAAVVVLVLNHLESDEYPPGLDAPSREPRPAWLPPVLVHPCPWCELCLHRFEIDESRIAVTVADRDGWHRLFWAGGETYTYDDPAFVGGALRNRTADLTSGTWTIRGRFTPVDRPEKHPCPPAPRDIDLRYVLRRGTFPGPSAPALDPSGALAVPLRLLWFSYPFPPERVDDFWWELENPDAFAGTSRKTCACN